MLKLLHFPPGPAWHEWDHRKAREGYLFLEYWGNRGRFLCALKKVKMWHNTEENWGQPKLTEFTFYYPKEWGIFNEIHFRYRKVSYLPVVDVDSYLHSPSSKYKLRSTVSQTFGFWRGIICMVWWIFTWDHARRNGFKMRQEGFQLDLREIFENTQTTSEKECDYVIFKREDWPVIFLKL